MQFIVDVETALRKTSFMQSLSDEDSDTFTNSQKRYLFKDIIKNIRDKGKGHSEPREYIWTELNSTMQGMTSVWTLREFLEALCDKTEECRKSFAKLKPYVTLGGKRDRQPIDSEPDHLGDNNKRRKPQNSTESRGNKDKKERPSKEKPHTGRSSQSETKPNRTKESQPTRDLPLCDTCGIHHVNARTGSEAGQCRFSSHEDANLKGSWKTSKIGKKYAELRPDRPNLDYRHKLNASMTQLVERSIPSSTPRPKSDNKDTGKKGTVLSLCSSCNDDIPLDEVLINATLSYRGQEGLIAITLLDPGARSNEDINLVDSYTLKRLVALGAKTYTNKATICDTHGCSDYKSAINLDTKLIFDENNNDIVDLGILQFQVVDKLPSSEVIIGWPTLKRAKIFCCCHGSISDRVKYKPIKTISTLTQLEYYKNQGRKTTIQDEWEEESISSQLISQELNPRKSYISSLQTKHVHYLLDYEMEVTGR